MPQSLDTNPYCLAARVAGDGSAIFECSSDAVANPWLALPPHHPVVVQTQAFWTAVGGSVALNGMETTKWSALTWIDWELGDATCGHATHGVYRTVKDGEKLAYSVELFNKDGGVIVTIKGRGVIFRNRNFEAWREEAKGEARKAAPLAPFTFADPETLGLVEGERVFVAPFGPAKDYVEALVTSESGFPPGNTFIGGSGDHVNSTHLHEITRQALFLVKERTDIDTSGTMELNRYVELGLPLRLIIGAQDERSIKFHIEQLDKVCAEITLRW